MIYLWKKVSVISIIVSETLFTDIAKLFIFPFSLFSITRMYESREIFESRNPVCFIIAYRVFS